MRKVSFMFLSSLYNLQMVIAFKYYIFMECTNY